MMASPESVNPEPPREAAPDLSPRRGQSPRLLNVQEAALWLGVSTSMLNKLRMSRDGARYFKIGTRVLYDERDLALWLEAQKRASTGAAP